MALKAVCLSAALLTGLAALSAGAATAAEKGLSGMWMLRHGEFPGPGPAPTTPAVKAYIEAHKDEVMTASNKRCMPYGMPGMMITELAIEVVESPERIAILSEQTQLPRSIYLNTAKHPDPQEVAPGYNGHSYGRWEGATLVVDTANFNDAVTHITKGLPPSKTTHLVERMHVENDGQTLVNEMTLDDPNILSGPWTRTFHYDRMPGGSEIWEYVCDLDDPAWTTALGDRPPGGN